MFKGVIIILKLNNISKVFVEGYNVTNALKDVNLTIEKGEMVSVMGPSGSGKSTLLNIIGLMDKPSYGELYINDELIKNFKPDKLARLRNKTVSFIFQEYNLLECYNVYENVEIPLRYRGMKVKQRKALIEEALKKLYMLDKIYSNVTKLSGGQKQRVAIARALVSGAEIIIADEPTGALDQETGKEIMNLLRQLNKEGKTIIIVTHDPNVAACCERNIKIIDGVVYED